jgi:hypothetical protein
MEHAMNADALLAMQNAIGISVDFAADLAAQLTEDEISFLVGPPTPSDGAVRVIAGRAVGRIMDSHSITN